MTAHVAKERRTTDRALWTVLDDAGEVLAMFTNVTEAYAYAAARDLQEVDR